MKVLLLIDNFGPGGAQRQIVTLAKLFQQHKFDVEFLTYNKGDFFLPSVIELGIKVHHIETRTTIQRIIRVRKLIQKGSFDVVISFLETPNFLNCISAVGHHKWKVITCERSSKDSTFIGTKHRIYNFFQRFSDAIVCNSENAMNKWMSHYPNYSKKLHYIYNAVCLPEVTSEYTIKRDGRLHIVVAASCQFLKNPISVAQAVASLPSEIQSKICIEWYGVQSVTVGGSACYDRTIDVIEKNGIAESMMMLPPTNDMANVMNRADCVAIFSQLEGLPNAICEGMTIGKPIIMSKVSDYWQLVDDTNGLLCEWDSVDLIAQALSDMVEKSNDELLLMGRNSLERAYSLFNPEVIIDKWIQLIKVL